MSHYPLVAVFSLALLFPVTHQSMAGESQNPIHLEEDEPWILPTLQVRGRFEHSSVDAPGLTDATALTFRERPGIAMKSDWGLEALVEGEFTQALIDAYDAGPGPGTSPDRPSRTQIQDPRNEELNQLWLKYSSHETTISLGRQRIVLDNGAIVGNSGWRQNEQTYDGVAITNQSLADSTFYYAYINRVNRIFGQGADGIQSHFSGDIHLLNAKYKGVPNTDLAGYLYHFDLDGLGAAFSNTTVGSIVNRELGEWGTWKGTLRGEVAWQADAGEAPMDYNAWYAHGTVAAAKDIHSVSLGYEYLGADRGTSFKTPMATAHAFNGYSDALVGARVGGAPDGIGDLYASYEVKLPWQITGQLAYHYFGTDDLGSSYGQEIDLVVTKDFNKHFKAITKLAFYDAAGAGSATSPNPAPFDTTRCSLELNYTF